MFSFLLCFALAIYLTSLIVFRLGLQRPSRGANETNHYVSVIIAARNESENLPHLLADLTAQTYTAFEALIVDDRSSDETAAIVRAVSKRNPHIKLVSQTYVPAGRSPKKSALQLGIANSCGELILLTDADCRVRPEWIETIARYFEPDVAMVLGASELSVTEASSIFERIQAFEFLTLVGLMAASAKIGVPFGASGHNIAYRRAAFNAVGGYESVMHRIAGDDMLMLQMIRSHRPRLGRIVYADDLRSQNATRPEPTWKRFSSQRTRWATSGTHHFRGDPFFMFYAVGSLVLNMTLLCGWMWAFAGWIEWSVWGALVAGKFAGDCCFFSYVCHRFRRLRLTMYLPFWFALQPVYLLLMAWWGQRGRFEWKP